LAADVDVALSADSRFLRYKNEVHVWHQELLESEPAQKFAPLLSPDERQRAARFRFPVDRQRFMVARATLRQLLAEYLEIAPSDISFRYSANGKPELAGELDSAIRFNVAHSQSTAAFAFTLGPRVGIDVELVRDDVDADAIARRFFSESEQDSLARLSGAQKYLGFFNCWTRKEAYLKAVGSGLFSLPLRDFDVTLAPGEPAKLLATRPNAALASHWSMSALTLRTDYAAAVVAEGPRLELSVRQFPLDLR